MVLYKYLGLSADGRARLTFLENELFRFTQPTLLNDPADCAPRFYADCYSPEDYAEARKQASRATWIHFEGGPTIEDLEKLFLTIVPRRRVYHLDGYFPRAIPELQAEPFTSVADYEDFVARRWLADLMVILDRTVGVFSMSVDPAHQVMWSEYAAGHRGVVVGFDSTHPFFQQPIVTAPVDYREDRVSVSSKRGTVRLNGKVTKKEDGIPLELFLRKHPSWQHQQEWRCIRYLRDRANAGEGTPEQPPEVCLFRIPSEAVRSIALGQRMAPADRERAMAMLSGDPRWRHVDVQNARLTDDLSRMQLVPVTGP